MSPAVFAHGHLRLYLLSLLAERSMHGYDLMQALEERFGGAYSPSAGTIYPRLAKLEAEGLVSKSADGRKSVYSITDAGRAELANREHELLDIESDVTDSVRRLADEVRASVNDAMKTLRADLAAAAREARADAPRTTRAEADQHEPRVASRVALHDAEEAIARFRADLRAELRAEAQRGALDRGVVDLLEGRLTEVRRDVVAALRQPGR
jgi:DNA-binding PadR family transcriptional regulator